MRSIHRNVSRGDSGCRSCSRWRTLEDSGGVYDWIASELVDSYGKQEYLQELRPPACLPWVPPVEKRLGAREAGADCSSCLAAPTTTVEQVYKNYYEQPSTLNFSIFRQTRAPLRHSARGNRRQMRSVQCLYVVNSQSPSWPTSTLGTRN
jgi:hypothetical protein